MPYKTSKVILDIETLGKDLKDLDPVSREAVEKQAERQGYDKEATEMKTAINPLTAEVIVIGMLNPDTGKGQIYYSAGKKQSKRKNSSGKDVEKVDNSEFKYAQSSEKEMLTQFWEDIRHYDSIITFNGRTFDIPFLITRSAIHKIKPTKNFMPPRYSSVPRHIDLLEQMTFYQPWKGLNSLHFFCKAFGIKSPKEGEVSGYSIKNAFKSGKYREIAEYNIQDLIATNKLYEYWENYWR